MGQQVVRQENRLGVLEVGAPRHRRVTRRGGLSDERVCDVQDPAGQVPGLLTQVHPDQGRDLVVARAAGPQPAPELRPGPLDQAALERGVHVLVVGAGDEGTRGHVGVQRVEGREHPGKLVVIQQAGGVQHPGVRA